MIRFGEDSDVIDDLTGEASIVFVYSDQVPDHNAYLALVHRFPQSEVVLIDRGLGDPTGLASVIDVENGAWAPGEARAWCERKQAAGVKYVTVYVNRSNIATVQADLHGITVYWWVATLDGTCHIEGFTALAGPTLVQFATATMLGRNADGSLIFDHNWHPQPGNGHVKMALANIAAAEGSIRSGMSHMRAAQDALNAA